VDNTTIQDDVVIIDAIAADVADNGSEEAVAQAVETGEIEDQEDQDENVDDAQDSEDVPNVEDEASDDLSADSAEGNDTSQEG
jgi:hypothetical protein